MTTEHDGEILEENDRNQRKSNSWEETIK